MLLYRKELQAQYWAIGVTFWEQGMAGRLGVWNGKAFYRDGGNYRHSIRVCNSFLVPCMAGRLAEMK